MKLESSVGKDLDKSRGWKGPRRKDRGWKVSNEVGKNKWEQLTNFKDHSSTLY